MNKVIQVDPNAINNVISSPKARQIIYTVITLAAIVLGAIAVAYGTEAPEWVEIATRVYIFVSAATGGLALTNTPGNKNQAVIETNKINTHRKDI